MRESMRRRSSSRRDEISVEGICFKSMQSRRDGTIVALKQKFIGYLLMNRIQDKIALQGKQWPSFAP